MAQWSSIFYVGPAFTADFDLDREVDGNGLAKCQGDFAANDGDSHGVDFIAWQQQFGSGLPVLSAIGSFQSRAPQHCFR